MSGAKTRPRTVLVLPAWYPTGRQPVAGVFVRQHARAAAAAGHRIVVVVDEGPSRVVKGLFELQEEDDEALRIVRLAYRPWSGTFAYLPGVLAVARRLKREGTPVDIVHAHVHRMGWAAVLAGALLRRPVVISEHSSEWVRGLMSRRALRRARIAFRRAALVCPVDRQLQLAIERYGVRARFRIVPNAVDTEVFHPRSGASTDHPRRLVNVAQHVEVKGLDVLMRAYAALAARRPELVLELIGDGPLTPKVSRLADDLGVAESVHFAGAVNEVRVAEAMRAADVFVLSSHSENLPVSLLEALCCGLPVAATRVGGIPGAVGRDGQLAPPGDPAQLASAIASILDDYDRFDGSKIAQRAASRWSLDAIGRIWDEIYRSL